MRFLLISVLVKIFVPSLLVAQNLPPKIITAPKIELESKTKELIQETPPQNAPKITTPTTKPPIDLDNQILSQLPRVFIDRRPSSLLRKLGKSNNLGIIDETTKQNKSAADKAVHSLTENLAASNWDEVTNFFSSQFKKPENAKNAYHILLDTLARPPKVIPPKTTSPRISPSGKVIPPPNSAYAEKHFLSPTELLYLADACPSDLNDEVTIQKLGFLLKATLSQGHFPDTVLELIDRGTKRIGGTADNTKQIIAARLLINAGLAAEAGKFLPEIDNTDDPLVLEIIANYHLALHSIEPKEEHLDSAWKSTQLVIKNPKTSSTIKENALERAIEIAPKLEDEKGIQWLTASFSGDTILGREILTTIGATTSIGRSEPSSSARLRRLTLQKNAVESLIGISNINLEKWSKILNLLAQNWLSEASYSYKRDTSKTMSPRMKWDQYGNMYYENPRVSSAPTPSNVPSPISSGELLKIRPNEDWIRLIDKDLQPQFLTLFAQLFLKVNEPEEAFPYIKSVANSHPDTGKKLAEEFLRVWADSNDPNSNRNRNYRYGYMYGFNQRANSIPLTRSKQERNLTELAKWISKIQSLPIDEINQDTLAEAFTKIHSRAEVYKVSAISKVFGNFKDMSPSTVAALANTMRINLATVWRNPKTQQDAKTNRKDDEILAEIIKGYEDIDAILDGSIQAHPNDWRLHLRRACLELDKINFQQESNKSSSYSTDRNNSYKNFGKAAELYISNSSGNIKDETTEPFEHWFYAALGASDLSSLNESQRPSSKEIEKIQTALGSLPDQSAERHLARFANALSARISSVKPELKQRYLRHGLLIANNHEKASEAQKLYNYYNDLTNEIQLVGRVDGSTTVGHDTPFGFFVDIKHTKEIERESGGFSKYLTNQKNSSYAYNYGRPTQNYRDKFEETSRSVLSEHFDVISITFHDSKISSKGAGQEGWRLTPYAYVLLQARTPEVDKIPSMQIDLDFLDTGGFVILPVATAPIPIDSTSKLGDARPVEKLKIVQIVDEREADQGILKVEVKASSNGLVPELDQLLKPNTGDFIQTEVTGGEITISKLDAESKVGSPISERNWIITYRKSEKNVAESNLTFSFPEPYSLDSLEEILYQRYDDADLVSASQQIQLQQNYDTKNPKWIGLTILVLIILSSLVFIFKKKNSSRNETVDIINDFSIPSEITPFSVLGLLRKIHKERKFANDIQSQLDESIASVEKVYFDKETQETLNLKDIAEEWVNRAV